MDEKIAELQQQIDMLRERVADLNEQATEFVQRAQSEEIDKVTAWLRDRWGDEPAPPCPYCGSDEWAVSEPVRLELEDGRLSVPMAPVSCRNCGNVALVDMRYRVAAEEGTEVPLFDLDEEEE